MEYTQDYFTHTTEKRSEVFLRYERFIQTAGISLKGQTVCDIGCATGNFLGRLIETNDVYGLDISSFAIEECKKKFPMIADHFSCTNLNDTSFTPDVSFSLITCFDVIEHLDNYIYFKRLINDHLVKNGVLVITTPNSNNFLRYFSPSHFTGEIDQTHTMLFTPYTLDFFLRRAGLQRMVLSTPYSFYFKDDFLTRRFLFGGQIFGIYKKTI